MIAFAASTRFGGAFGEVVGNHIPSTDSKELVGGIEMPLFCNGTPCKWRNYFGFGELEAHRHATPPLLELSYCHPIWTTRFFIGIRASTKELTFGRCRVY
ncbi:hypothetical protein OIU85_021203 [Salix viminalis]|uniref:Uncharacterized protein n=1 Tax=Salix viminalis TaxID=40686 RepID=A0A9Q0UHV9_SALVM|nr:hypothetical protein OIU85_021203 [Salix viminalis]